MESTEDKKTDIRKNFADPNLPCFRIAMKQR
jgi:hypothetical protein